MLLSPYYPANYGNNDFCVWNITAGENYRILLEFENFDVSKTGGHKGLNTVNSLIEALFQIEARLE